MSRIEQVSIDNYSSILSSIQKMDEIGKKLLLVFDKGHFVGLLSIGDVQRAIIKGLSLESPIQNIMRKNYCYSTVNQSLDEIKSIILSEKAEFMPILNNKKDLVDVIFWEDLVNEDLFICRKQFKLPVVIMAGGVGSRMKPLTNILPKPLIPIGEKTIVEDIMDKFISCGSSNFFFSVNYKSEIIKEYFNKLPKYNIEYVQESKPLGTAGSLKILAAKINSTFFVSNCDIIINDDYSEILKYHKDNHNLLTLVGAIKSFSLPYGIIETKKNGLIDKIVEKPKLPYTINTGMYILEPQVLDLIPENMFFHITDLIESIISSGGNVGCFPISEDSWIDIGNWDTYYKIVKKHVE